MGSESCVVDIAEDHLDQTKSGGNGYSTFSSCEPELKEKSATMPLLPRIVILTRSSVRHFVVRNRTYLKYSLWGLLLTLYCVYFGFAMKRTYWSKCQNYCDGGGLLLILTVIVVCAVIYQLSKRFYVEFVASHHDHRLMCDKLDALTRHAAVKWCFGLLLLGCVIVFLVLDSTKCRLRLVSAAGILVFLFLGYVFSKHPAHVVWKKTLWGLGLQFIFAIVILRWDVGRDVFQCLAKKIATFLSYTDYGSTFIYGYLVNGDFSGGINVTLNDTNSELAFPRQPSIFAFKVLPVLFFFSFVISILYYYGIMQRVLQTMGQVLQSTVGTTSCESLNAAAAIFVGQSESPLLIQPYIVLLTKSELHAVLTGGFANIAGSTMAAYISFGIDASYLLSASLMSAPAALGFSKLIYPESEESRTAASSITIGHRKERNVIEAAANGAMMAVSLVSNIAGNLVAFIAFIYFVNGILSWFGSLLEWDFLTVDWLLSRAFMPVAFIMGVEWQECEKVGKLIGMKTIYNEFLAYEELSRMTNQLTKRSRVIATYALCGFANLSSIGIQLGCLGSLSPERKSDIAEVIVRAFVAGVTTNLITACVAGSLIDG